MFLLVPWSFSVAKAIRKKEKKEKIIKQYRKKKILDFFCSFTIYFDTFMWHITHGIHKKRNFSYSVCFCLFWYWEIDLVSPVCRIFLKSLLLWHSKYLICFISLCYRGSSRTLIPLPISNKFWSAHRSGLVMLDRSQLAISANI